MGDASSSLAPAALQSYIGVFMTIYIKGHTSKNTKVKKRICKKQRRKDRQNLNSTPTKNRKYKAKSQLENISSEPSQFTIGDLCPEFFERYNETNQMS